MRLALAFLLFGCSVVGDSILNTAVDPDCIGGSQHLAECCPGFHSATIRCWYDQRNSVPEISKEQARCLQSMNCYALRAQALSGYACGVATHVFSCDGEPEEPAKATKQSFEKKGE